MIPQETVDLILSTARIEEVIGDFVTLKRRGSSYVACCPFHNERTPSFHVTPSKGIYKCFGCGKGGSAVGFLMDYDHRTYGEALRYLADKYHIDIVEEELSAEEIRKRQYTESLYLVMEFAAKYFAEQLDSDEGRAIARQYINHRGLQEETVKKFGIGWAPSGFDTFVKAALAAGYKEEYLIDAGLAKRSEKGSLYCRFRERVMFPIHSVSGRVIAFSGRTLHAETESKYVNSDSTPIYVKSRILMGIYHAKSEIAREDSCILVEGNVDVVMLHQLGIRNAVASCGTALTVEQVRLIHRFTDNVTIMYDSDSAGIKAANKAIPLILSEGMNVNTVLLPEGEDPDSFSRSHTLEQVRDYIRDNTKDFISYKTDMLLGKAGADPLKKAELINDIADTIACAPDAVKRSVYADTVAARFGVEASIIQDRVAKTHRKLLEEEQKEEARAALARQRSELGQEQAQSSQQVAAEPEGQSENTANAPQGGTVNKTMLKAEMDILHFVLKYGCDRLEFESDSDYYSGSGEDAPTVTDFINESLEADGATLANSILDETYRAYMELYYEGYDQDMIIRRLLGGDNREIAAVVADLSTEKYRLTIQAFENALTTTSSWLVIQVPRVILAFNERRLQNEIDLLKKSLKEVQGTDREQDVLSRMMKLQKFQREIRQKLGREKSN